MATSTISVYGYHSVIAILTNIATSKRNLSNIYILPKYETEIKGLLLKYNLKPNLSVVNASFFDKKLPPNSVHQGIMCDVSSAYKYDINEFVRINNNPNSVVLIIDHPEDSRNVGAIIRNAVAFNVDAVVITKNSAAENALMHKAAAGNIDKIKIIEITNLQNALNILKKYDYWVIGLDAHTDTLVSEVTTYNKIALILGAEGKGMRQLTKKECDLLVKIPTSAHIESLNVTNACAIALYEIYKQRNKELI